MCARTLDCESACRGCDSKGLGDCGAARGPCEMQSASWRKGSGSLHGLWVLAERLWVWCADLGTSNLQREIGKTPMQAMRAIGSA